MKKRKSAADPVAETRAADATDTAGEAASATTEDRTTVASADAGPEEATTAAARDDAAPGASSAPPDDATGSYGSEAIADAALEGGDGLGSGGGEESDELDARAADGLEETEGMEGVDSDGAPVDGGLEDGVDAAAAAPSDLPVGGEDEAVLPTDESRLLSIVESLLFASDRALGVADLKRLLGERDGKRVTAALETLRERRADTGIQLASVAGGWQLRTHPANGAWVAKLVAGRPQRLSRAMMETLAIVAYRQPITRPEIDEIRGVDCGPVLRTLLDRSLIRVIGKKEEVGRPILYGTTPEFLKTFSLRDLTELPTLRDFHELGVAERAEVDAKAPARGAAAGGEDLAAPIEVGTLRPSTVELPNVDPDEEEALLDELEQATESAGRAAAAAIEPKAPAAPEAAVEAAGAPATDAGER